MQFETIQEYRAFQSKKAMERRIGEERRKQVRACVEWFGERRATQRRED